MKNDDSKNNVVAVVGVVGVVVVVGGVSVVIDGIR